MGDAAEDVGYWDEWGQWIDGYGVYDEEGNYVYPDGSAAGQPAARAADRPGTRRRRGFGSGESAAEDNLDGWEQMYDDDGHAYYFNHHTSNWQYEEPEGFAAYHAAVGEQGYWDEQGEYQWHEADTGGIGGADAQNEHAIAGAAAAPCCSAAAAAGEGETRDFVDSKGWQAVDDGYGNLYYYNRSGQCWEAPASYSAEFANNLSPTHEQ